jgi:hypothetical protein
MNAPIANQLVPETLKSGTIRSSEKFFKLTEIRPSVLDGGAIGEFRMRRRDDATTD